MTPTVSALEEASTLRYPFDAPPAPGEAREVAPGVLWLRMAPADGGPEPHQCLGARR